MMFITCEPPAPTAAAPAASAEAAAPAEFGGLDLVDYIQVHPLRLLLGNNQCRNEQRKHC